MSGDVATYTTKSLLIFACVFGNHTHLCLRGCEKQLDMKNLGDIAFQDNLTPGNDSSVGLRKP